MRNLIKFLLGSMLLGSLLAFGLCYAEIDPSKGSLATEVIRGSVTVVDQKNHLIHVGGTRIGMPPLGKITLKIGQRVSVFVYREKGIAKYLGLQNTSLTPGNIGQ